MGSDLQQWSLPRLQRLLPIDDESLREIVTYTSGLSKDAGAEHLKNLLGDSSQALEFISTFNSRRPEVASSQRPRSPAHHASTVTNDDEGGVPSARKRQQKKQKPPLHSAGPARTPQGFGNVSGGYSKQYASDSQNTGGLRAPDALQVPQTSQGLNSGSSATSRDASPAKSPQKLPPSASGNLISDFGFANVRAKQSKKAAHAGHSPTQSGTATLHKGAATTTVSSVSDLTAAIAALELSTNPALSTERRKCTCNASIHPLFTTAPNCLNCGKIICALEGLQPCSFCDSPILTRDQVHGMIKALKEERGVERMVVHNAGQSQSGKGTPVFGGSTPDSASGDEASSAASRARAHRDKLLAFQRENAQRTRVHDEAADYDATLTPGTTQWMSPVQRAAALKKQQKYLRELEEANRPEWEKKKTVMSMSIKNGKLVKTYERGKTSLPQEKDEPEDAGVDEVEDATMQHLSIGARGAFSNNPLLTTGKLIRPMWKGQEKEDVDQKGKGLAREGDTPRKSVWRRVQDDNEDNEQWILDGGLHGYGTVTRIMEDGSQQECG